MEGAVLFLFNVSFYWDFLDFLAGFPVFIAWFFLTIRKEAHPPVRWYAGVRRRLHRIEKKSVQA
ncbi:MAG: hypothetical protein PHH18_04780 [Acidobacteriota bacterium]|nr:hypothetical protein [Acidobacteriota bacterium]